MRVGSEGLSKRGLGYAQAAAPLAVSGSRGVACTFVGLQRLVLLDLVSPLSRGQDSAAVIRCKCRSTSRVRKAQSPPSHRVASSCADEHTSCWEGQQFY